MPFVVKEKECLCSFFSTSRTWCYNKCEEWREKIKLRANKDWQSTATSFHSILSGSPRFMLHFTPRGIFFLQAWGPWKAVPCSLILSFVPLDGANDFLLPNPLTDWNNIDNHHIEVISIHDCYDDVYSCQNSAHFGVLVGYLVLVKSPWPNLDL